MILEDLSFPFTNATGDSIQFSATFVKVRKVDVSDATVGYSISKLTSQDFQDRFAKMQDAGKQQTDGLSDTMNNVKKQFGDWWNGDRDTPW